jgi:DNA (cytosine-5)-methyltransferase 1
MESIELFTGAGGLALGSHAAGFHHKACIEWNGDACATLRFNSAMKALPGIHEWNVVQTDIRDTRFDRFRQVDLVAGGPPCQPFSLGGKHKGMNDGRNMLPEFARAVRELQPRAFIMENVKGLLREQFRNYFEYILLQLGFPDIPPAHDEDWEDHLRRLEDAQTKGQYSGVRYNVVFNLLNAADYGVPQTRERVFVVGFRSDTGLEWHFPQATHSLDALRWDQWITGEYWKRHEMRKPKETPPDAAAWLRSSSTDQPPQLKPYRTIRDVIVGLPEPRADRDARGVVNHRLQLGARSYPGHTGSPIDLPSKTLKAGVHGVPGGENTVLMPDGTLRYLTVREAARVQTFPDKWHFAGAWSEAMRQLGNAVPMGLAQVVAASVAQKLEGTCLPSNTRSVRKVT